MPEEIDNALQDEEVVEAEEQQEEPEASEEPQPEAEGEETPQPVATQEATVEEPQPEPEPEPAPYVRDLEAVGEVPEFRPPQPEPAPQYPPPYAPPPQQYVPPAQPQPVAPVDEMDPEEPVSAADLKRILEAQKAEYQRILREERQAQQRFVQTMQRSQMVEQRVDAQLDRFALTQSQNYDMRRLARDKIQNELNQIGSVRPWTQAELEDAARRAVGEMYGEIGLQPPKAPPARPATTGKASTGAPAQPPPAPAPEPDDDDEGVNLLDHHSLQRAVDKVDW